MKADELYDRLKQINEPKGYFFNKDIETTMFLIEGLITNRNRYGYMSCPCRMAKEDIDLDRDIICPCEYRKPDVEEYGSCYCGLYVSEQWNNGQLPYDYVPERRPVEKC